MEIAFGAARWVVGRALAPVTDGLLESWAASSELGSKIGALKMELLYAQGMLDGSGGRDDGLCSPALAQLLLELRQLAYKADDAMDELEYFRIQDELDGTYETTDAEAQGFLRGLVLNTRHTARAVAGKLKLTSCCASREDTHTDDAELGVGRRAAIRKCFLPCCSLPSPSKGDGDDESRTGMPKNALLPAPKLKFDRVDMSTRMTDIIEQFKPVCAKVSTILGIQLLRASSRMAPSAPPTRPKSTSHIIEPTIYGRENQINTIAYDIHPGKYLANDLTVLPVLGVGGIGKTTFTQHLYDKVKSHFQVPIWVCVSHGFNADILAREILDQVPKVADEKTNNSNELLEKRLQSKRFLLVLDDVWTYHEDEWKKLLAPFRKAGTQGNMVIVTTRIPEVAQMVGTRDCLINLECLDRADCMLLFKACVFDIQEPWENHADLHEAAGKIVDKLKGSPLAVKTVGRLLRNQLDWQHWNVVLESKEWELQTSSDDIMPALKLSYNYLPFHVQQCFSYCGLFPEDYKFTCEELIHLWIGLGLLDSGDGNKRVEDIGLSYLNTLVNQGFFIKSEQAIDHPYYVIHDLLHDLAVNVSSYECLSIHSSNVRSVQIPASVRHLSVIVDNTVVSDRITFENFRRDLGALDKRLKPENLRTLMLFGEHHGSFAKTFGDLFREAKALRVIFLSGASYNVEEMMHNFSYLVHLRYLRIKAARSTKASLPSCVSRFYHLLVLDVQEHIGYFGFVRYMSNLVKMRHFVVGGNSRLHSEIFEVGKLRFLQELRSFEVKKETNGFQLKQLGQLTGLRGSLGIYNLEKVQSKREAGEAKLVEMNHLYGLILDWGSREPDNDLTQQQQQQEDILDSLKPHGNLRELCIRVRGDPPNTCPTWLLSLSNLESLHLEGVAWDMLPLPGRLCMVSEHGGDCPGCAVAVSHDGFKNLKSLKLVNIPTLKKWCGDGTRDSSLVVCCLQELVVTDCANLTELPFSHSASAASAPEKEGSSIPYFPELATVQISNCPNLSSLPPIPWTRGLCSVIVKQVGVGFEELSYSKEKQTLKLHGRDGCSTVWKTLALHNLTDQVRDLEISNCSDVSLHHLQALACLETLSIVNMSISVSAVLAQGGGEGGASVLQLFPVKKLYILSCDASGKELTELLSHFPSLSRLEMQSCDNVTGLGVASSEGRQTEEEDAGRIGENDGGGGGLLLLPPEIKELTFYSCGELGLLRSLQGLGRLESLYVEKCVKFLPSDTASCSYFSNSLQHLCLWSVEGTRTLPPIPSLMSLTVYDCAGLTCDGAWPSLTVFFAIGCPKFFAGRQDIRRSSRLETLHTDDVAGALTEPSCGHLASSLAVLILGNDSDTERFTEAQEEALPMLFALRKLRVSYLPKLRCLPAGLGRLAGLETLEVAWCDALQSLPRDGLPGSLKVLDVAYCPAIRALPKDLPASLRELNVHYGNSEQLTRQCRKFKGIIPIVKT